MNKHQSKGLELEIEVNDKAADRTPGAEPTLSGVIRRSFRIPSDDPLSVYININNQRFELINFDIKGLSFCTPSREPFKERAIIEDMELVFREERFPISGKIIHITPFDKEHQLHGSFLCGVELIHSLSENLNKLEQLVAEARRELMTRN